MAPAVPVEDVALTPPGVLDQTQVAGDLGVAPEVTTEAEQGVGGRAVRRRVAHAWALAGLQDDPRVARLGRLLDPTLRIAPDRMEGTAVLIKVPALFGIQWDQDAGFYFYARNLSLFVLPLLTSYFVWKRRLDTSTLRWLAVAFVAAGVAFAHAMRAFRWVRDHYVVVRGASGAVLVTLGLLLFFDRDWWLRVALDQVFTRIGLGTL